MLAGSKSDSTFTYRMVKEFDRSSKLYYIEGVAQVLQYIACHCCSL